ncbi:glycosyltransferase family 2 protein [Pseudomonas parasichuanensis]|uniref:glycosyltransferase family 2 protein n=1 Tax=Pseudomonas parasichuanensis TaxID=2892329 RepID=UPI001F204216|nr:glycosyltransferase family 2 protein [Pseudomonas parasichuanensis]
MPVVNNNSTRFSVVVPTFNSAKTLLLTLESLRSQFWSNLEVLIVDGLSSDNTVEIARSFCGLDLKIICEPDQGIYDAINKGVANATGDLICVIGSDDRLAIGALQAVHDAWMVSKTDIVAGGALLESPEGVATLRVDEHYGVGALVSGIPFCHNSMFVTSGAYLSVGKYDLNYKICADADWVHRSIRMGCTCARIDKPLVHFSLCGTSSVNDELIMAETYAVIASNFPGLSLDDAETLFKAVRRWTDDSQVADVLGRNSDNLMLAQAVATGLYSGATIEEAGGVRVSRLGNSLTVRVLRKIQRLFRLRSENY